jgi:hypothetical protein
MDVAKKLLGAFSRKARSSTFSARHAGEEADPAFSFEPPLTSPSVAASSSRPLRTVKLNPLYRGAQAAVADLSEVEPDCPADAMEDPIEEEHPPQETAIDEQAAPVGVVNVVSLLTISRKITDEKHLEIYHLHPTRDPLLTGPLGVNVVTLETSETAVAVNVMPRFMCVTISFFHTVDAPLAILTSGSIENWKKILKDVDDVCRENIELRRKVRKALDKHVKLFASNAFLFIDNVITLRILKRRRYKYADDIEKLFARFFREAEKVVKKAIAEYLAMLRTQGNVNAATGGNAEPESPSGSSDGDIADQ